MMQNVQVWKSGSTKLEALYVFLRQSWAIVEIMAFAK